MKHKTTRNRLITMLLAIVSCFAMLFGAVFNGVKGYVENKSFAVAEGAGARSAAEHTYELTGVEVAPIEGWIFTEKTPKESLYKMVTVTVAYDNIKASPVVQETTTLTFTGKTDESGLYLTTTGEKVKFEISVSVPTATVTVTVTPKADAEYQDDDNSKGVGVGGADQGFTGTAASSAKDIGIYAKLNTDDSTLPTVNAATDINMRSLLNYVLVYPAKDDGSYDDSQNLNFSGSGLYVLSGDFFPASFKKPDGTYYTSSDAPYSKEITISEDKSGGLSTTFEWPNIKFVAPVAVDTQIQGTMLNQVARSTQLDLTGLTVDFEFPGRNYVAISLTAFVNDNNALKYTYYTSDTDISDATKTTELTTAVKTIDIEFTYKGELSGEGGNRVATNRRHYFLDIAPLPIHAPGLPDMRGKSVAWNEGAKIDITNWDYYTLYPTDFPIVSITAVNAENTGENLTEYLKVEGLPDKETVEATNPENNIVTVNFLKAGVKYRLSLILVSQYGALIGGGDFQWTGAPTQYVGTPDKYELTIDVQVDKGAPELTLSDIAETLIYGNQNGNGTLSATIEGEPLREGEWVYDGAAESDDAQKKKYETSEKDFCYYLEYYTGLTSDGAGDPAKRVTGSELLGGKPKNAGTYYVFAVSYENNGYISVSTKKAHTLTITPFEVQVDDRAEQVYARRDYKIADFLPQYNPAGGMSGGTATGFPYGEDPSTFIQINSSQPTFRYADEYSVTVDIFNTNYKLQGTTAQTKNVTFVIKTNTSSSFSVSVEGWLYGKSDADPKLQITGRSTPYYAQNTGSGASALNDFTVTYYKYDGSKPNHVGTKMTDPYSKWVADKYVVEIIAIADMADKTNEKPALTEGKNVSYTLPVVYEEFAVTAAPIVAPHLEANWVYTLNSATRGGQVHRYNDVSGGLKYTLKEWSSDNTAVDNTKIITVTVTYTQFITSGNPIPVAFDYEEGSFIVDKAGYYTVKIELNSNYEWQQRAPEDEDYPVLVPSAREYWYVGTVARQQLTLLTDETYQGITGDENVYSGKAQTKSIDGWNDNALTITSVTVTGTTLKGDIVISGGTLKKNQFSILNAGDYTARVDIADKDNYEWDDSSDVLRYLELTYTLEKALLNVKWASYNGDPDNATKGPYAGTLGEGPHWSYAFTGQDGEQHTPLAVADLVWPADNSKITRFTYAYYGDNGWGTTDAPNSPLSGVSAVAHIGTYYILVTKFEGEATANYKLPDMGTDIGTMFEITPYLLEAPHYATKPTEKLGGQEITETYRGSAYTLEAYIHEYTKNYVVGGQARISVTVQGGGEAKDAKNFYTIVIKVSDTNFKWAEAVEEYTFKLIIEQLMVEITWNADPFVNTYGDLKVPGYSITNRKFNDALTLELSYKQKDGTPVSDINKANAGEYIVYASGLSGVAANNYKIVAKTEEKVNSNESAAYIIQKRAVTKPTLPKGVNNGFNGTRGQSEITWNDNYDKAGVKIVISGILPKSWFTNSGASAITLDAITLTFGEGESAWFNYTRAAIYTFEVSLNATNYYWDGDKKDRDFTYNQDTYSYQVGSITQDKDGKDVGSSDAYTVNRVTFYAPNIKEQRAQEWDKETLGKGTLKIDFEKAATNGIEYSVVYGRASGGETSDSWLGYEGETKQGAQGIYYAELTLKADQDAFAVNKDLLLNYVWVVNTGDINDGTGSTSYLQDNRDIYYYVAGSANGSHQIAVRIFYAITKGQLDLELKVKDYVFGDNGYIYNFTSNVYEEGEARFNPAALLGTSDAATVYLHPKTTGSAEAITKEVPHITEYYFLEGEPETLHKEDALRDGDLVNYLPWKPGTYTLFVTLRFGAKGETYENLTLKCKFTVKARTITSDMLSWDESTLDVEYNAEHHLAKVTLNNMVSKTSHGAEDQNPDNTDYTYGITLVATTRGYADGPVNANLLGYEVKVTAINDDADGRFTLPADGAKDLLTNKLIITRKKITIIGKAVEHVYGDVITDEEKQFYFLNGDEVVDEATDSNHLYTFFNDGAKAHVKVYIYEYGKTTQIPRDAAVSDSAYYVHVCWDNDGATYAFNYDVTFLISPEKAAKFTIVKREVTLEWDWSGEGEYANDVYGQTTEDRNLYNVDRLKVYATNSAGGKENAFIYSAAETTAKDFISFLLKLNGQGDGIMLNTTTGVGRYQIVPAVRDGFDSNWTITFKDSETPGWWFDITPATIKAVENTFALKSDMAYIAAEQNVFTNNIQVTLVNRDLNFGDSKWQYGLVRKEDATAEDESDVKTWNDINKNSPNVSVYNAGEYFLYVKITAPNHSEFLRKLTFKVEKAQLSVKFDFAIMYGEVTPDKYNGVGYHFGLESLRTRNSGWTVTGFIKGSNDEKLFYKEMAAEDDSFYNLDGTATYTVNNFPAEWDWQYKGALPTYEIEYSDDLTCTNYTFVKAAGTLTIKPIKITVTATTDKIKLTYNQEYDNQFPGYPDVQFGTPNYYNKDQLGTAYTIEYSASSYDPDTKYVFPAEYLADLVKLIGVKSNAFDELCDGSRTGKVGTHDLEIVPSKESDIFNVVNSGVVGKITIKAAQLEEYVVTGYDKAYDELYHGLTVNGKQTVDNTPDTPDTPWAWNDKGFTDASDGQKVNVEFWVVSNDLSDYEIDDEQLDSWTEAGFKLAAGTYPVYIDFGTHYVVYRISAANYTSEYGYATVKITVANNTLTQEFKFANAKIYGGSGSSDTLTDVQEAAWTYGYMVSDKDGFLPTTDHVITNPTAAFKRADATHTVKLKYKLTYYADLGSDGEEISDAAVDYENADALFTAMFNSAEVKFNAGYYELEVYMTLSGITFANFKFTPVKYYFKVAKRAVTVSVNDETISYGQDEPEYTLTGDDEFVKGGPKAAQDTIATAIKGTPLFAANAYKAGNNVNTDPGYVVTIQNENALPSQNYEVTYAPAHLHVKAREITITIVDKTATYNKDVDEEGELIERLVFTVDISGGKFNIYSKERNSQTTDKTVEYTNENQTLLILKTDAVVKRDGQGDKWFTNNVKWKSTESNEHASVDSYTIYAIWNLDSDTKGNAWNDKNYSVKFALCHAEEQGNGAIQSEEENKQNNAGKYKIERADATIINQGLHYTIEGGDGTEYVSSYYNGEKHYWKAYLKDQGPESLKITYSKGGNTYEKITDAGTYDVYYEAQNWNYRPVSGESTATLAELPLTLVATEANEDGTKAHQVQYGTTLTGNVISDADLVAAGRFTGFKYTVKLPEQNGKPIHVKESVLAPYVENTNGKYVGYRAIGYDAKTSVGNPSTIRPVAEPNFAPEDKNKNMTFSWEEATLVIKARVAEITILGWDDGNDSATTTYTGDNQGLQDALTNLFKANYAKFIDESNGKKNELFGASEDDYSDLILELTLDATAKNVGVYDITNYGYTNKNYSITFTNLTAGSKATFKVKEAPLKIYAYEKTEDKAATAYSAVYGSKFTLTTIPGRKVTEYPSTATTLRYSADGLQGTETLEGLLNTLKFEGDVGLGLSFTITVEKGSDSYEAWTSGIGKYTVAIEALSSAQLAKLSNYEIVGYESATLTITQRLVSVSTSDREFTFGDEDTSIEYHEGEYGIHHDAVLTYKDGSGSESNVNTTSRPVTSSIVYAMKNNSSYGQDKTLAPTKVGSYTVTVTLPSDGNYKLTNGSGDYTITMDYSVTPKYVNGANFDWKHSTIATQSDEFKGLSVFENLMDKYRSGYMEVTSFIFNPLDGDAVYINAGNNAQTGVYFFADLGKLAIRIENKQSSLGTYTVRIELKADAKKNVILTSGTNPVEFVEISFKISSTEISMTIEFEDYYYGADPTPPIVKVAGKESNTVSLMYAPVKSSNPQDLIDALYTASRSGGIKSLLHNDEEKGNRTLLVDSYTIAAPTTAGYYVLRAYSSAASETRYFVFQVKKALITAPTIEAAKLDTTYNGVEQKIELSYVITELTPSFKGLVYNGTLVLDNGSATFSAINADTYTISFTLANTANTEWATKQPEGATISQEDGNVITYTWTIHKDVSTSNHASIVQVTDADNIIYGDGVGYNVNEGVTLLKGYNGEITLFVQPKTDAPMDVSGTWMPYNPAGRLDAGNYWLKVVVTDSLGTNFADKIGYGAITVKPKEINAYVTGTIIYGNSLAATMDSPDTIFEPEYVGLLSGDKGQITAHFGQYSYSYVGDLRDQDLTAGTIYYIILATDSSTNNVIGIDGGRNYVIKAIQGRLEVLKRNVVVKVDPREGFYAEDPAAYLTQEAMADKYSVEGLPTFATKEVLNITFSTTAVAGDNVGSYLISIQYDSTNYIVSYESALFTIKALEIEINLEAQENIFFGDTDIKGTEYDINDIIISSDKADRSIVFENLRLVLHYTGTSYKSGPYDSDRDDRKIPWEAGVYTAQLLGAGDNFILTGSPSVEFTIQKQYVENSALEIKSQTYTGSMLTPVLSVKKNEAGESVVGEGILELVRATIVSYKTAGTYQIIVTLEDAYNYQWRSTQDAAITVPFEIIKANDALVDGLLTINGWQYGCYSTEANSPSARTVSGTAVSFEYSTDGGETFTNIVPDTGSVGVYYVRVVVADSENYFGFTSDPVAFYITKYYLNVPEIIASDGTFTGSELSALISNYDARYMAVMDKSEARTFVGATNLTAVAINAGEYKIYISINDFTNCGWLGDAGDNAGVLTLTWTVNKMKVALPTAGKNNFVVNGSEIVYIPEGFDESIMAITNNVQSYGGNFTAVITLKDTSNYEWADGSIRVELKWHITGASTLLAIILAVLGACVIAGVAGLITQSALDKRRKRTEAAALAEIENKDLAEGETAAETANSEAGNAEGVSENAEEKPEGKTEDKSEEKAEDKSEEKAEDKSEEKAEDKSEEKAEEKSEEKSEEKTEEKAEETPKPKPKQKSGNTSKSKSGKGGKQA